MPWLFVISNLGYFFDFFQMMMMNNANNGDNPHNQVLKESCCHRQSKEKSQTNWSVDPTKVTSIICSKKEPILFCTCGSKGPVL